MNRNNKSYLFPLSSILPLWADRSDSHFMYDDVCIIQLQTR